MTLSICRMDVVTGERAEELHAGSVVRADDEKEFVYIRLGLPPGWQSASSGAHLDHLGANVFYEVLHVEPAAFKEGDVLSDYAALDRLPTGAIAVPSVGGAVQKHSDGSWRFLRTTAHHRTGDLDPDMILVGLPRERGNR